MPGWCMHGRYGDSDVVRPRFGLDLASSDRIITYPLTAESVYDYNFPVGCSIVVLALGPGFRARAFGAGVEPAWPETQGKRTKQKSKIVWTFGRAGLDRVLARSH